MLDALFNTQPLLENRTSRIQASCGQAPSCARGDGISAAKLARIEVA
jgi:hypothetical protein